MMLNSIKFLLLVLLISCGDSPFLDDSTKNQPETIVSSLGGELRFQNSNYILTPFWKQGPFVSDESKMLLIVTNSKGVPSSVSPKLKVLIWMPTMDHGSFPLKLDEISEGVYEISEIYFTMPGYWDIHFQIESEEKIIEEIKWGLTL